MKTVFTSESVTEGHPDKVSDQISDGVLDAILKEDKDARVACETLVTNGIIFVTGEITTSAYVNIKSIVEEVLEDIGYNPNDFGVIQSINQQSPDISMGVNTGGAGDQGMMFGFACDETPELMPLPIILANKLTMKLAELRKNNTLPYLKPDGKAQVTVEYENGTPTRIDTVIVSAHHSKSIPEYFKNDIQKYIIDSVLTIDKNTKIFINPTGRFEVGGPQADTGLTGRKIIVDTYGGYVPHGGGAFSGKDPTKVDRSAAYMGRHIAKSIVGNGLAKKCLIQVSYAIGVEQPTSVFIDTYNTETTKEDIVRIIMENFDLRPRAIIEYLDLKKPIYRETTNYGHFGRNNFSWEKIKQL